MSNMTYEEQDPDELTMSYLRGVHDGKNQRTWVGLTDEEIETLIHRFDGDPHTLLDEVNAKLKEKNHG